MGVGTVTPCLKLVRITLETSNLVYKYTNKKCSFRKLTFWYQGSLNFSFFCKISALFGTNSTFTQYCESCARDFFVLFSVFVK